MYQKDPPDRRLVKSIDDPGGAVEDDEHEQKKEYRYAKPIISENPFFFSNLHEKK